jgi:hypothetical protein
VAGCKVDVFYRSDWHGEGVLGNHPVRDAKGAIRDFWIQWVGPEVVEDAPEIALFLGLKVELEPELDTGNGTPEQRCQGGWLKRPSRLGAVLECTQCSLVVNSSGPWIELGGCGPGNRKLVAIAPCTVVRADATECDLIERDPEYLGLTRGVLLLVEDADLRVSGKVN